MIIYIIIYKVLVKQLASIALDPIGIEHSLQALSPASPPICTGPISELRSRIT